MPRTRLGRDLLLALLALPLLTVVAVVARNDADWFPQQYADEFYIAKGLTGMLAVVLLVIHMARVWSQIQSTGQRLRYLALLVGTTAAGSASTTQFSEDLPVVGLNVTGLLFVAVVAVAMVVSIAESNPRP